MMKREKKNRVLAMICSVTMALSCVLVSPVEWRAADFEANQNVFTDSSELDGIDAEQTLDVGENIPNEEINSLMKEEDAFFTDGFSDGNELSGNTDFEKMQSDQEILTTNEEDIEFFEDVVVEENLNSEEIFGDAVELEEAEEADLLTANTTFASAIQIGVNSTYKDKSLSGRDNNLYKFTIAKAGYVSFTFGKEYDSNANHRWYLVLYNSSKTEMMSRTFYCGKTTTETTCKVGVPAGTYYMEVIPEYYNWSNVMYNFKVNYISSTSWETEFNDAVGTADNLALGTTYYGNSCEKNDVDYYKISIPQSGCLSLSFGKEYDSNANNRWYVTLYDASQSAIFERTFYCGTTATKTTCKVGVPSGIYYVRVCPEYYHWSDVTYNLKVNFASSNVWETEFNDTVGTTDNLVLGTTYYGTSCEGTDIDYYKINIPQAGCLSLSFGKEYDSNANNCWYVTLYDASQNAIFRRTFYCGTAVTETTCKVGVPAGTYYIRVCPEYYHWSDVTYKLKANYSSSNIWETEFNDDVKSADNLRLNKTYYGTSSEGNDVDYYKFDTDVPGYLSLFFGKEYDSSSDKHWYVEVFDSLQRKIKQDTFYCGNTITETTDIIWITPGSYYIKVKPEYYKWSDVTYNLKVNLNLQTPSISSVTNTSSGISLKWGKTSGASGYYVYRKAGSNGKWTKIKTISGGSKVSYTDTAVKNKNGTTYYYRVYAYNSKIKSTASGSKKIVRMTAPVLSTLKNISGKKITVKWKKNSQASGYQIQYSTSKNFSSGNKLKSITGKSTVSTTIAGLLKGKTYYIRMRSFKTVNGVKYYSAWSSAKYVKIQK